MDHPVVSEQQWIEASQALLRKEKEFTRARDALSAERRKLPWLKVTKNYVFTTPEGPKTLGDLFGKNSQLIVYHFMFAPGWKEGCPGCSFISDHVDGALPHLTHHDVSFVAVSRAETRRVFALQKADGLRFPWVSSAGSDFNRDYQVSFTEADVAGGQAMYNFEKGRARAGRIARHQHLLQGRTGGRLPHLFVVCTRRRHAAWCLQLARPDAERAERRGPSNELDAQARSIRMNRPKSWSFLANS